MNISIKPSSVAKKLARTVGGDFYLVGGYVRNSLLGKNCEDEDVCSALTLSALEKKLAGSEFTIKNRNKVFGTCKIICGNKSFDYATFRKETYSRGHCPDSVEFVKDLSEDANRRDFTINSIYYNINKGEIKDPFDGMSDLKRKKIRSINSEVLNDDGLRILRMIRLAGEYNFSIEKQTFLNAQKNISNIKDLTISKVAEELQKLFTKTSNKGAVKAINLYNKLGVWKQIKPDLEVVKPNMIAKCEDKTLAFAIDLVDSVKPASVSYFLNHVLQDSGVPKKRLATFINIVSGYYDALNHLKNKQFFFKYFDNFPEIYKLLNKKFKILAQKYNFFYKYIISHKLVIRVSDLKITVKDLKKHFPSMPEKLYESVLMEALSDVFEGKCQNELSELLRDIGRKHYHKF